ncbi:uncharacterized protein LOC116406126 isoform X3 [Cucumis sativus]|uniref:uncharacterized protein LOC116406126 isoform X3 n=1 Tax=Cucumis sativus TaxID=3659 RepID=UPI0012F486F8|nr:uncharacterized protein LOC116406126 isoform X3 [Cucumis sativus]
MEELRKLEQVHTLITLMDSRGIPITSSSSSNRFIANFLLLLVLSHSTSSLLYVLNSSSNLNISIPPLPLVKWCNHVESLTLTINSIWFLNTCRSFRKSFLAMYHCCLAMETIGERRWKTLCSLIVTISWILVLPRTIVGKWLWLAWMQCSVQILHLKIFSDLISCFTEWMQTNLNLYSNTFPFCHLRKVTYIRLCPTLFFSCLWWKIRCTKVQG